MGTAEGTALGSFVGSKLGEDMGTRVGSADVGDTDGWGVTDIISITSNGWNASALSPYTDLHDATNREQ